MAKAAAKAREISTAYSDEDIARVKAFVAALKTPAQWLQGKTIKRLSARIYRQLWDA
jgi:cytochrome c553